ncbi:MAG: class I SAM-dependent methyltransferase [Candidatus Omnitrophica bacterium]|nr:class I SAM-dependent methyltransferase [Candidatus Omnitrophota bacterium]
MVETNGSERKRLEAARRLFEHFAELANAPFYVRLWDGSLIPMGRDAAEDLVVTLSGPGVLGSLLRGPNLENLLREYVHGRIEIQAPSLIEFFERVRKTRPKIKFREIKKSLLVKSSLQFLFATHEKDRVQLGYNRDETGRTASNRDNREFVQFHYDLSNDFYKLFLDPEMQYSCAYFNDWTHSLERAQLNKLEMICRKLRLKPGEKLLDIGCGWGGLICYAAKHYGVTSHGVTLSQKQFDFAQDKIDRMELRDRVSIELRDYNELEGTYDKIASIGMYEHVGIAQYPQYFRKIHSLLRDRGILLNHGITRRAKRDLKKFKKIRPENRLILKYIFPGSELDHVGHTVESLEAHGFEVHDVEGWREHYALTCKYWCQRLEAESERAISFVGPEKYRMWIAYLAGVSLGFADGSLRIFQVVASKHRARGPAELPPSRGDLYERPFGPS